ncbi:hypothetical protein F1188_06125 [Roseospira marina]|uniref:ABC transmembrane type-1 domain-containing protein n=1 Tax=Roseospira marina TaxID=140057 RepID=A0A5M6IEB9_9PROT|nr:hypothetical protein [Roseospira marina]KAA5606442.1 hypothetical protein F1188_06125 [Roseospira marina]MBB4314143.1 ABC-type bacteriocin/lantibiotic exporter with double-glycine peptidase domain [Roseospira marina]MBB5087304.1 ABC-type bacteriocin/lantibiotic exporter with double-glycine peptidase domain [Roseospira marina]
MVQLATIATIGFGSTLVLSGAISVGALSACTLIVGRFLAQSQTLVQISSRVQVTLTPPPNDATDVTPWPIGGGGPSSG